MSGNEIVKRDEPDLLTMGQILADSGYFKDARDQAQAIVKVLAGREYGLGPFASMTGIHIVEGKPSLSAHLMALGIKKSGRYDYRVLEHSNNHCTIVFREKDGEKWEEIGRSTYTIEDARQAGLAGKGNWQKYARSMLFARALSEGYRTHCPDALGVTGPTYVEGEIEPEETITVAAVPVQRDRRRTQPEPTAGAAPTSPPPKSPAILTSPAPMSLGAGGVGASTPEQDAAEVEAAVERAKERRAALAKQAAEGSLRAQLEQAQSAGIVPPKEPIPDPGAQPARRRTQRGKAVTPEGVAEELAQSMDPTARLRQVTGDGEAW